MSAQQIGIRAALETLQRPVSEEDVKGAAMIAAYYQDCDHRQQQQLEEWLSSEARVLAERLNANSVSLTKVPPQ